jgi:cell wall-associated NlpC family hydrolase
MLALLDTLGQTEKLSAILSRFGPFALLAFLLLFGVTYTIVKVEKASDVNKATFRKILIGEMLFVLLLSVFAMFVWYKVNVNAPHIITGSIEGLRDELVVSDQVYLRPKLTAGFSVYEWKLITDRQLDSGEKVDIVITSPQFTGLPAHHNIEIEPGFYGANAIVKLVWRREEGRIFYLDTNVPLPVTGSGGSALSRQKQSAGLWRPWAVSAASGGGVAEGIRSSNPVVREAAIRTVAQNGVKSVDTIVQALRDPAANTMAAAIIALNLMDASSKKQISQERLLGSSASAIVRAMGADQDSIRQEARLCITWYDPKQIMPVVSELLRSRANDQRLLGVRILATSGSEEAVAALRRARAAEKDPAIQRAIDEATSGLANSQTTYLNRISPGKRREAMELAFKLKDKNIPFKWGGKTESDGFDSSGFAAYVLSRVGALKNPEKYYSGLLQQTFKPPQKPEIGDLVFYEYGYIAFFLGSGDCIGMKPSGIVVGPVDFGPKRLGYGRVSY